MNKGKVLAWIKELFTGEKMVMAFVIVLIMLLFAVVWNDLHNAENKDTSNNEVIVTSQKEAETVQGIEKAAEAAQTPITVSQAKEVVEKIKYIRENEQTPIYVTQTTAAEAPAKIDEAKEIAKADFAVVTSKDNPNEKINIDKLDPNTPVELNQYNVQAYPKALRQLELGRGTDGGVLIGASVHKKVSDNGQYLGLGVDYDTERSRLMAKVIYTW